MTDSLAALFLERSRYFLGTEYLTKLRSAVDALPPGALWWRANGQSNSVGNLLLHLNGNIRQWIVRGVGGAAGSRDRAAEFAATTGPAADVLMADPVRRRCRRVRLSSGCSPGLGGPLCATWRRT